ncbi:MAG: DUF370 domain-containing protein [Lachnospiraceae bacterium]|nr:DUF370 domain-containing protein [Lachnospiraceae bacterium]
MTAVLVNVGYGNVVNMNKVISIVRADAAPIKRMIQNAKDAGLAVDATCGRKTKCILVMDSGHLVLSALLPETIESRAQGMQDMELRNNEMEEI